MEICLRSGNHRDTRLFMAPVSKAKREIETARRLPEARGEEAVKHLEAIPTQGLKRRKNEEYGIWNTKNDKAAYVACSDAWFSFRSHGYRATAIRRKNPGTM